MNRGWNAAGPPHPRRPDSPLRAAPPAAARLNAHPRKAMCGPCEWWTFGRRVRSGGGMIVPAPTRSCSSSEPRQKQGRPVAGISRGNLCVAGYALHLTTPDLSQGMAAMAPWWGQEARGGVSGVMGTPVVVKMQTTDWAISEVPPSGSPAAGGKDARQITWVLLLKAHRAVGKLTGAATAALSVAAAARRRVAAGRTDSDADADATPGESPALRTRFYGFLRAFLLLSVLLLAADVAAHAQGWHLAALPDLEAVEGLFAASYSSWMRARAAYLGPALQFLTNACVVLFMIQSADRLILCLGYFWIKLRAAAPREESGGEENKSETVVDRERIGMQKR